MSYISLPSVIEFSLFSAQHFASGSAQGNKKKGNTKNGADVAAICAVTASNSADFINNIIKVWIPVNEIAKLTGGVNDPAKLMLQEQRIANAHSTPTTAVRFAVRKFIQPKELRCNS